MLASFVLALFTRLIEQLLPPLLLKFFLFLFQHRLLFDESKSDQLLGVLQFQLLIIVLFIVRQWVSDLGPEVEIGGLEQDMVMLPLVFWQVLLEKFDHCLLMRFQRRVFFHELGFEQAFIKTDFLLLLI